MFTPSKFLSPVTRIGGRIWLKAKKHAPAILFVAGTALLVGSVASAIKDTMTAEPILVDHEDQIEQIKFDLDTKAIDEQEAKKATRDVYISTSIKFAKHYGRTIILTGLAIAAYGGSYSILHRRYTGAMVMAASVTKAYETYRQRVRDDAGEEKDLEYLTGHKVEEVAEIVKRQDENGEEVEEVVHDTRRYCELAELENNLGYKVVLSANDGGYIFDEKDLKGSERIIRGIVRTANDVMDTRSWYGFDEMLKYLHKQVTISSKLLAWKREDGPIICDIQRIWYNDKPDGSGTTHPAFILDFHIDPAKMAVEDLPIPKI